MVAYTYRMPAGIAGDVNRFHAGTTIEVNEIDASDPPTEYGIFVILDASVHAIRPLNTGDTTWYGLNVRPFPTSQVNTTDGLGVSTPPVSGVEDVLKRGYMTVRLRGATAAVKGGAVYGWAGATAGGHDRGGVEAAAGASGILITGAYFMGPADANGITEIAFNL
jgi:hypothetical protein